MKFKPAPMRFKTETWVAWIGATVAAALTMAAFAFATFETKEHSKEVKEDIAERLTRIESKIDDLPKAWGRARSR